MAFLLLHNYTDFIAEKQGCINYQDIISFDNDFLIKNHLYDAKTDELNEDVIKKATIKMINRMIKDENMNPYQTRWMANIHYDTDNIHIHISTTELKNTRKIITNGNGKVEIKGKRRKKTLENMKSSFSNSLLDSTKYLENITQVRNDLYHNFKIRTDELETLQAIKNLKKQLPVSKKHWQYNNKEVKHLQPDIDKITTSIVNRNNVHSYNQYMESIGYVANFYKEIYGENSNALNYIDNKNKELKQRLGNKLLKELKKVDYDKKRNNKITENIYRHSKKNDSFNNRLVAKTNKSIVTKGDLYKIDKAINDETKDYLNQIEYEKLQRKIEFENNH
ncbi:MobP2 family relaxase [Staphylococcus epidermidis]